MAKGWSIYGAQRAQPVATGGKWETLENRSNKPIRNRRQPTATVLERMVRRGSPLARPDGARLSRANDTSSQLQAEVRLEARLVRSRLRFGAAAESWRLPD
jgi:hypothetical protein